MTSQVTVKFLPSMMFCCLNGLTVGGYSTLIVVTAVLGGLLLFVALHCSVFVLSSLFPVILMEVVYVPSVLLIYLAPRNHVIVGDGTALLLISHMTSFSRFSLNVSCPLSVVWT